MFNSKKRKIAAVPVIKDGKEFLLVECHDAIKNMNIEVDNEDKKTSRNILLEPTNETGKLELSNPKHMSYVEDLYVRRLQINVLDKTDLKIISKSPNVYYESNPFNNDEEELESDISCFMRFYVFSEYIAERGLGFGVDIGTSFFTNLSVYDYFKFGKQERFIQLKERQSNEYKGTLLYKGPNGYSRCYFERYDGNTTLSTTDSFNYKGRFFQNSFEYFQQLFPQFVVNKDDSVAFVSFKGIGTVPVPAKYLFLTVSNSDLDDETNQQDKYTPSEKRQHIDRFWKRIGNKPFGDNFQNLRIQYFIPGKESGEFELPDIIFAGGQKLSKPKGRNRHFYSQYFKDKYYKLKENGCFYVPPMMERNIHFIFPKKVQDVTVQKLIYDITFEIKQLTKVDVETIYHCYEREEHLNAIYELKNNYEKGTVVFIFDNQDPSIYYNISQELEGWKIIRLTEKELFRKHNSLTRNYKNKGQQNWDSYITLNAFRVVTELGCIPYVFEANLNYESQLVIDVSERFRHFGIGLMLFKSGMPYPIIDFEIRPNPDSKNDLINPLMLEKYLSTLIRRNKDFFETYKIINMLVLRDGKENKTEYDVFTKVINELCSEKKKILPLGFKFAFIEYHKKTKKSIRLFNNYTGEIRNPLEGSYLILNNSSAILANTGDGTLTQGTASPILIKNNYFQVDLLKVLYDNFLSSQLNFGSPRVAQRLTYLAKRVDDLLKEERAKEVIKIR